MDSINDALTAVLQTVRTPGDFYAAGHCALHVPLIEVEGAGPIALPLLPAQAAQLIAVSERAPYGRGGETLVDTAVRRTWQIGADRVRIAGKHWTAMLDGVVERSAAGLGAGAGVVAELYKLLVYDEGSFFVTHRDTENWSRPDGAAVSLGTMPFTDSEVCPGDALADMDPDEQHFEEATGNEGASFERSYQRAALVLWPQAHKHRLLARAGFAVSLPMLGSLVTAWVAEGAEPDSTTWREAHSLAAQMLACWPVRAAGNVLDGHSAEAVMLPT